MDFLSHLSIKSIVGYLVGFFVLACQACGVDVHDLAPSLSLAIANLANAVAALVPLGFAVWGHIQLAKKHETLVTLTESPAAKPVTAPMAPSANRGVAETHLLGFISLIVLLSIFAVVVFASLTGCAPKAAPTPTPAPVTTNGAPVTPTPAAVDATIEAALPLIRTGAAVATGVVLDFTVQQSSTRTRLANEMYAAASAIYSLSGGAFPTPAQLQKTVTSFGGSQADASYAQFSSGISSLYALYYPKLSTGADTRTAEDLFNAIAGGIEDATASYVTVTAAPSSN